MAVSNILELSIFGFVICENNSYNENQSKHLTIVKNNVVIFFSSQSLEYLECTSVELHLKNIGSYLKEQVSNQTFRNPFQKGTSILCQVVRKACDLTMSPDVQLLDDKKWTELLRRYKR